jgi:transcriptional regulator GlxA family with amidase domain
VIWNGAEVLDWAGPSEVFEAASRFGQNGNDAAFNVYTVSKTREHITSQRFVEVKPNYSIEDAPKPDVVVFPGGGTRSVMNDPAFLKWAGDAATNAEVALSVCTGAFILGTAGLLDGKEATTWYGALDQFEKRFAETHVRHGRRFVDNGQVVTTAGVSAGIDGSLHVVARLLGRYVADRTAQYMEYRWTPEPYLARDYKVLSPSLDDRGRRAQRADIHRQEKNMRAAISMYEELLTEKPDDWCMWQSLGNAYYADRQHERAAEAYVKAATSDEIRVNASYNAACSFALAKRTDDAFESLGRAIDAGFNDAEYIRGDADLTVLRDDPRFERLLARAAAEAVARSSH